MAKIILSEPKGPYRCTLDTDVMDVVLKEVFLGVIFKTADGEALAVCMRDSGFEVHYMSAFGETRFDAGITEFKNGVIKKLGTDG